MSAEKSKKQNAPSLLGYDHIEALLETEDFKSLNESFASAYERLEKIMSDVSGGLKKQKAAQKAMKAYELTTELMNELLKTKYQIARAREAKQKSGEKK